MEVDGLLARVVALQGDGGRRGAGVDVVLVGDLVVGALHIALQAGDGRLFGRAVVDLRVGALQPHAGHRIVGGGDRPGCRGAAGVVALAGDACHVVAGRGLRGDGGRVVVACGELHAVAHGLGHDGLLGAAVIGERRLV